MKQIVRENLFWLGGVGVTLPICAYVLIDAYGLRKVLTVLTGLVLLVAIYIVARDMDNRIKRGDFDA